MPVSFSLGSAPSTRPYPWGRWWLVASVYWGLNALVNAVARPESMATLRAHLLPDLVSAALWVPVTVLTLWLATVGVERHGWTKRVVLALIAATLVVLLRAGFVLLTNPLFGWYATPPAPSTVLAHSVANNFVPFFLILGAAHALVYAARMREREELLTRAELQHLKSQLHPHFLFNTLNAISAFIRTDPDAAESMLARLSTLLRHALQREGAQEVSLEEELAMVAAYVEIEQLRFDDRLRVTWEVEGDTLRAAVPHLLLQPLVENAIRHGIAPLGEGGTVSISARRRGEALQLEVRDDGVGMPTLPADRRGESAGGIGLSNARQRLRQLYGVRHRFTLHSAAPRGLAVEIELPFRLFARVG